MATWSRGRPSTSLKLPIATSRLPSGVMSILETPTPPLAPPLVGGPVVVDRHRAGHERVDDAGPGAHRRDPAAGLAADLGERAADEQPAAGPGDGVDDAVHRQRGEAGDPAAVADVEQHQALGLHAADGVEGAADVDGARRRAGQHRVDRAVQPGCERRVHLPGGLVERRDVREVVGGRPVRRLDRGERAAHHDGRADLGHREHRAADRVRRGGRRHRGDHLSCWAFTAHAGDPASTVTTAATRTAAIRALLTFPPRKQACEGESRLRPSRRPDHTCRDADMARDSHLSACWAP